MLALSDAATTGLFALGVAIVGAIVSVIGILVTHDTRRQNRQTQGGVSELSIAWDTMKQQLARADRRIATQDNRITVLEEQVRGSLEREQNCLDALQANFERLAVLEERLGHRAD